MPTLTTDEVPELGVHMRPLRSTARVLVAAGLLAVAACSGDGTAGDSSTTAPTTVATYSDQLRATFDAVSIALDDAATQADAQADFLSVNKVYYTLRAEAVAGLAADVAGIAPPAEMGEPHGALITAAETLADVAADLAGQISGADSEDDLDLAVYDETYDAAFVQVAERCAALEVLLATATPLCGVFGA